MTFNRRWMCFFRYAILSQKKKYINLGQKEERKEKTLCFFKVSLNKLDW